MKPIGLGGISLEPHPASLVSNMTENQQKAFELLNRYVMSYLDTRYDETREHVKAVYEAHFPSNNSFQVSKVNEKVADLMIDLGKTIYVGFRPKIAEVVGTGLEKLVGELFNDEESDQLYNFCQSPVGQKFLRNLDLVREIYTSSLSFLSIETMKVWNSPEVNAKIQDIIKSFHPLEEQEEKPEFNGPTNPFGEYKDEEENDEGL